MEASPNVSRRHDLERSRTFATLLLVVMAGLYLVATPSASLRTALPFLLWIPGPLLPWLRAFAEAAMVGALADWFAVTALFRHPLNIPIPHTAIIPRNKSRIGVTLGEFVRENFLTPEVIGPKIRRAQPTATLTRWLSTDTHRSSLCAFLSRALFEGLKTSDDRSFGALFAHVARDSLSAINFATCGGEILAVLISEGKHRPILESSLILLEQAVDAHHTFIRAKIREGMPWWVPTFVRDKIYDLLIAKVKETLREVNSDQHHVLRGKIDEGLALLVHRLRSDPLMSAEGERFKSWLLSTPVAAEYSSHLFETLKAKLLLDLQKPDSRTHSAIGEVLFSLTNQLNENEEVRAKTDTVLEEGARWVATQYGSLITRFIAETVESWDTQTLIEKFELEVGQDLQFIRINGTLVGGLVGVLLYALTLLLE